MLKIEEKIHKKYWEIKVLNFFKLKNNNKKFKIQNFTKMKKTTSYIHPRNIHTDFEKYPNIRCWVTDVDRRTDRLTDRPTTRHGNRSSGPKNQSFIELNLLTLAYIIYVLHCFYINVIQPSNMKWK